MPENRTDYTQPSTSPVIRQQSLAKQMRRRTKAIFIALCLLSWSSCRNAANDAHNSSLTDDEKHRLYAAALATSDSPLDTDLFKQVCQRIEIFDANNSPNDQYLKFVAQHIDWSMKSATNEFRREIDSKDKARDYISKHLSL